MLSALKNFVVTLLIAAAVFGVIAFFTTKFVTAMATDIMGNESNSLNEILSDQTKDTEAQPETDINGETVPSATEDPGKNQTTGASFTFAIVVSDYRPELFGDYVPTVDTLKNTIANFRTASDSFGILSKTYRQKRASAVVLVRVDKERKEYTYTYISPETRVYTSTGYHTLGDVYAYYGYEQIGKYVMALTGIHVDYTFLLNGYNLDEWMAVMGAVTIQNPKSIYSDGTRHTTRSETTEEYTNDDGKKVVDHHANSLVLSAGNVEFNAYSAQILNTLKELSSADIDAKGTYTVEIVKAYVEKLAAMEQDAFIRTMQSLLVLSDAESAIKTWRNDGTVTEEPATPILETADFSLEDAETVYPMIAAAATYSSSTISYPGNFVTATKDVEAYYDPDINTAVKRFLPYRFQAVSADTADKKVA